MTPAPSRLRLTVVSACLGAGAGCAATDTVPISAEQSRAIETREIDAPPDATLRAVAATMLDEGMLFTMSDSAAGLLAASPWVGSGVHTDPHSTPPGVVICVRPLGDSRSSLRVQCVGGAGHMGSLVISDPQTVSRFAALVQQRTLLGAAPPRRPQ